jgi:hypothetical protein
VAARLPALVLAFALAACAVAPGAAAEGPSSAAETPANDQGTNYHFSSNVTSVTPRVVGLGVQVLEFADRLLVTNHTGQTVTIYGYQNEPYARVLANGTAEVNQRSPATYLNTSFYGNVKVPAIANPEAAPRWSVIDRTGQFEWHDHRIHWNAPTLPPQVKDKGKKTLIFHWTVPIAVGSTHGAIAGNLFWLPQSSSAPVAAIVVGIVIAAGGLALVLVVRRRRRAGDAGGDAGTGPKAEAEAW